MKTVDEVPENGILVALLVDETSLQSVVHGSVKDSCDKCNSEVWISPYSLKSIIRTEKRPKIICHECIIDEIRNIEDIDFSILYPIDKK